MPTLLNGGMELLKDMLVPAVWWNDTSGDWGTMANWNSGQPLRNYDITKTFDPQPQPAPYVPPVFPNMTPSGRLDDATGSAASGRCRQRAGRYVGPQRHGDSGTT